MIATTCSMRMLSTVVDTENQAFQEWISMPVLCTFLWSPHHCTLTVLEGSCVAPDLCTNDLTSITNFKSCMKPSTSKNSKTKQATSETRSNNRLATDGAWVGSSKAVCHSQWPRGPILGPNSLDPIIGQQFTNMPKLRQKVTPSRSSQRSRMSTMQDEICPAQNRQVAFWKKESTWILSLWHAGSHCHQIYK